VSASGEPPPLDVERRGHVVVLRLNRPEKRNAVDAALAAALAGALEDAARTEEVRVAVLTGAGPAFCAGADLTGARPAGPGPMLVGSAPRLTAAVDAFCKPVLAAVNGPAFGGGCELALAADLRVAAESATFCLPEVRIGSMPGSGGVWRLVHAVGSATAAKLLYTGEPIDAAEARRVGLVSDVLADDALLDGAVALAERVAENAPLSLLAVKRVLRGAVTGGEAGGLELERALWALLATTVDRAEGRAAFGERRPPHFEGR
jgi:enoyl-CoA hydratase/carnithine racemase